MKQIDALCEALKSYGLEANPWKGYRIYINVQHGTKAFFELDTPDREDFIHVLDGVVFKVFTKNDRQPVSWCVSQSKQVKHGIMKKLENLMREKDPTVSVPEDWRDIVL